MVECSVYSVECHGFESHPRQLRKGDCLGCAVLLCFVVCLTLLASLILPSHLSLKHVYTHAHTHTHTHTHSYTHTHTHTHMHTHMHTHTHSYIHAHSHTFFFVAIGGGSFQEGMGGAGVKTLVWIPGALDGGGRAVGGAMGTPDGTVGGATGTLGRPGL